MLDARAQAPSPDLAPFVRQLYVFEANLPGDMVVTDRLYADNAFVRVVLRGDIAAPGTEGQDQPMNGSWLLGGNLHGFPLRITGPFRTIGFAIRPCAWRAFFDITAGSMIDRAEPLANHWGDIAPQMMGQLKQADSDEAAFAIMEDAIRQRLASRERTRIDEQISLFEQVARTDSAARVEEVAARLSLSSRQFERRCYSSYGLSPKTILRRSRFLDIAAAMKGFAVREDQELAMLGYFDQSHRNREFRKFIGMTPGQFLKSNAPLMALGLSMREQGKALI
jgi:AraC-like DNA-binding protein